MNKMLLIYVACIVIVVSIISVALDKTFETREVITPETYIEQLELE